MRIVFLVSEAAPFAKTGGLADVAAALPAALAAQGHDVSVMMPLYAAVRRGGTALEPTGLKLSIPLGTKRFEGTLAKAALPGTQVPVYFIDCPAFYGRDELYGIIGDGYDDNCSRFVFFSRAAIEAAAALNLRPQVFHVNDWQTALVPVYLKTLYRSDARVKGARSLLTIHNIAYQGRFWHLDMPLTGLDWSHFNWRELEFYGKICFLKGGIVYADRINTVSPTHAVEIQAPEGGWGLDGVLRDRAKDVSGIVNGVDYSVWSPAKDGYIAAGYSAARMAGKAKCKAHLQGKLGLAPEGGVPLVGMISRMADQKGFDILARALPQMMSLGLQFALLGSGVSDYQDVLRYLANRYPGRLTVRIGFDEALAHEIEAGSDMYLMPSAYEPCGLNQLYSLAYGTVPVARATGGLVDTVTDCTAATAADGTATGFLFDEYSSRALSLAVERAVAAYADGKLWRRLVKTGMQQDWSWDASARKYGELYEALYRSYKTYRTYGTKVNP